MSDFVYTADPETREVTRRHRDRAAFAAFGQPHPLAFWSRHPNVDRIGSLKAKAKAKAKAPATARSKFGSG
jgi:hypothetical protein